MFESAPFALGRHMTVELCGCDPRVIADPEKVEAAFLDAARFSGAHVLNWSFHRFEPQGVSGFVIISESHFSIHAWPEHDYAAVDIFTCGGTISHEKAISRLKELLGAREAIISSDMCRGTVFKGAGCCPGFGSKCGRVQARDCSAGWSDIYKRSGAYAMLCAIDLRNADKAIISDSAAMKCFVAELEKMIAPSSADPSKIQIEEFPETSSVAISGNWAAHSISGRFDLKSGGVYMELVSRSYFEPRECGEHAVNALKASAYRLHLALRM